MQSLASISGTTLREMWGAGDIIDRATAVYISSPFLLAKPGGGMPLRLGINLHCARGLEF